jgi:hypothetical protein
MSDGLGTQAAFTSGGNTDPLAGLEFFFRGYGLPDNLALDTAASIPATADNDPIASWIEQGNFQFAQATSGFRPLLKNISGKWAARFDGLNDRLANADYPLSGDFTIFIRQSTTGDCCLIGSNGTNYQILRIGNGGNRLSHYFHGAAADIFSAPLTASRGVPNTVGIIRSGSTITFYEGTATRGTATSSAYVAFGMLGALNIGGTLVLPTTGDIHAVLIAASDMTANVPQIVAALDAL